MGKNAREVVPGMEAEGAILSGVGSVPISAAVPISSGSSDSRVELAHK